MNEKTAEEVDVEPNSKSSFTWTGESAPESSFHQLVPPQVDHEEAEPAPFDIRHCPLVP